MRQNQQQKDTTAINLDHSTKDSVALGNESQQTKIIKKLDSLPTEH